MGIHRPCLHHLGLNEIMVTVEENALNKKYKFMLKHPYLHEGFSNECYTLL